jgi:molecular chaperone GrpE
MTQVKQPYEDQPEAPEETQPSGGEPGETVDAPAEPAGGEVTGEAVEAETREAQLEAELAETKDRLLRTLADMENLRRRTERELDDARKYAISNFAREMLDVADNLSRALESIPSKARQNIELIKNLAEGVEMTEKTLLGSFEHHHIVKLTPEPGEKFDHNRHQAMFEVETDQHPPGTIAQILQPGYMIADRLLRPVMVGVAKAPAAGSQAEGTQGEPDAAEQAEAKGEPGADEPRESGRRIDTSA